MRQDADGEVDGAGIARGESVNLFSGGLTLILPIGGTNPIGPSLGLGRTLVYNSHLWRYQDSGSGTQVPPSENTNAGLGWTLALGRLLHPDDSIIDGDGWTYLPSISATKREADGERRSA